MSVEKNIYGTYAAPGLGAVGRIRGTIPKKTGLTASSGEAPVENLGIL